MPKRSTNSREAFKVEHNVFDEFTNKTLYKLISKGLVEGLESPLSIGKESNVFTARDKEGELICVKIYRLETCDFTRMFDYIKADPRYLSLKKRQRNIIFAWTQREYRNLLAAREGGVSVPLPTGFMNNVLVLECIGNNEDIAPKLKDQIPQDPEDFFDKTIKQMKKLHKVGLVHADLSPFNILNRDEKPVFIDFSQGTQLDHPRAKEFLERDVHNICQFFLKLGVDCDEKDVLKTIIGK